MSILNIFTINHPSSKVKPEDFDTIILQLSFIHKNIKHCFFVFQKGHLLAIYPGGVREAIFANDQYETQWNARTGFAKVGLSARVVCTVDKHAKIIL